MDPGEDGVVGAVMVKIFCVTNLSTTKTEFNPHSSNYTFQCSSQQNVEQYKAGLRWQIQL